ncbi:hypothetical protein CFOL_v3_32893, partial [Cephalotus follicularis]
DPAGVYHQTCYGVSYDTDPFQALTPHPNYEFNNYNLFDYYPTPYHRSRIASSFSEPKYVEYEPRFTVSYSVAEFNFPEFEDLDPTPYGGGYDIGQTYGKPLPPSEETCYPCSSVDSDAPSLNGFSYGSFPPPYAKEEVAGSAVIPRNGSKPTTSDEVQQILGDNGHASHNEEPLHSDKCKEIKENCEDSNLGASYGDPGNENEKMVSHIPSGYGLEAMDLCESIFGYWPCLSRYGKAGNDCQQAADEESYSNQWKGTADYLFGSSYPYNETRDDGNVIYGYERHYQHQSHQNRQFEHGEDLWIYGYNIF